MAGKARPKKIADLLIARKPGHKGRVIMLVADEPAWPAGRPIPLEPESSRALAGRVTFDSSALLAARYRARAFNAGLLPICGDYAEEIRDKLVQLNFLLKGAYVLNEEFWQINRALETSPEEYHKQEFIRFSLELYTESFYYFAHRLQTLLKNGEGLLPFIEGYKPARGARMVRNQLLEHPERADSGGSDRRWALSSRDGPQVKAVRRIDQPRHHKDAGLFPNAVELEARVSEALHRALIAWDAYDASHQTAQS